ncbi:hypothetical protein A3K64_02200 [Candidatus Micrarchaeota archaeon RBG_16_36_9]|nr:MAG: hypothetical protein A3K64_02200 [Candidatus Micrarchaeota archaeon RBG_16_36_9]
MSEYKLKGGLRPYTQPAVSYFDGVLEAGEKTVMTMVTTAAAVALALLGLLTSTRGSENSLSD